MLQSITMFYDTCRGRSGVRPDTCLLVQETVQTGAISCGQNSCSTMFHCIILCHSTVARAFLHIVNWLRLGKCFGESHILYCIIIVSSDCVALQRTAAECMDTFMSDLISSERSHTEAINSGCDPRSTDKAPSVCITRATHANKV